MATGYTAQVSVSIASTMTKDTIPAVPGAGTELNSVSNDSYSESYSKAFAFGVGSGNAKGTFHGTWSCAAGSQVVFDLTATMSDALGDAISATEVKAVYIRNVSTTTGDLLEVLGDAAAVGQQVPFMLAATDAVQLGPGGAILIVSPIDGWAVAAGATDRIEVDNNQAGAIEFEIVIIYEHV